MTIQEKIFNYVSKIPKGKVTTYGKIAKKIGTSARAVGKFLHKNKNPKKVPCHRVVFSDGSLSKNYAFGGIKKQKELLLKEKVKFSKDKALLTNSK
jgi:O-6-methylguanine DNA methyltransferase